MRATIPLILLAASMTLSCLAELGEIRLSFTNLNGTVIYTNALVRKITSSGMSISTDESLIAERWTNIPTTIRDKYKPQSVAPERKQEALPSPSPEADARLSMLLQLDSKIRALSIEKPWSYLKASKLKLEIMDIQEALMTRMLQNIANLPGDAREDEKLIENEQQRIDNNLDIAKNENWKLYKAKIIDYSECNARDAKLSEAARISMLRFKATFEARQRAVRAQSAAIMKAHDDFDDELKARLLMIDVIAEKMESKPEDSEHSPK